MNDPLGAPLISHRVLKPSFSGQAKGHFALQAAGSLMTCRLFSAGIHKKSHAAGSLSFQWLSCGGQPCGFALWRVTFSSQSLVNVLDARPGVVKGHDDRVPDWIGKALGHAFNLLNDKPYRLCRVRSSAARDLDFNHFLGCKDSLAAYQEQAQGQHNGHRPRSECVHDVLLVSAASGCTEYLV
jgi:hypothetical protein